MDNYHEEDKPPSKKVTIKDIVGIGTADIPVDDIKGEQRMGFWDRFTKPILYPAGSSVCTRCHSLLMDFQGK